MSAPLRSRASTTTVAAREAGDDAVARRKAPRRGLDAGRVLGDDQPRLGDAPRQVGVRGRVVAVDAAAEDRDRRATGVERAAMRLAVDAAREPADDDEACGRRARARGCARPTRRSPSTRARRRSRPRGAREASSGASPRTKRPTGGSWIERSSGGSTRAEAEAERGEALFVRARVERAHVRAPACAVRWPQQVRAGLRREHRERELVHDELLGRAIRECFGDVLGVHLLRSGERSDRPGRRGRHARGRGRRAASGRPRARAVHRHRVIGASGRIASASRASATRTATGADASAAPAASSTARGRGTATTRSKRSSSARESFARYAASRCAVHEQLAPASPRAPHGQRFIVATSWNRAGKTARPAARAMQTTPSSSGWRSASRAGRANSASSSRRRTPWCARLASPGRMPGPPPTIAAVDALWCGARKGGVRTSGCSGGRRPATEWMRVTSSAAASSSGGRMPGSLRASIVFPVPGGPARRRFCLPAAAISSARRARSWPRTSARSGSGGASISAGGGHVLGLELAAEIRDRLGQMGDRDRPDSCERRLRRRLGRAEKPLEAEPARSLRHAEHAPDAAQAAVERDLADRGVAAQLGLRDLPRRGEQRERDREVVAGAFLAQACRREVDGHPAAREVELGRGDAAAHARPRLRAGAVGEADDRE